MSWFQSDLQEAGYTPPSWSTSTDAEIVTALEKHYSDKIDLTEYWSVGDERVIHLNAMAAANPNSSTTMPAQDITIVIVDMNHTDLETPINGHDKACITVQTKECLHNLTTFQNTVGHVYFNGDAQYDKTFVRWNLSYLKGYLNSVVWNAFPSDFKAGIKTSKHYRHTTYNGSTSEIVNDNLFLPSHAEIHGVDNYSYYTVTNPTEGTQLEYYKTSTNRAKYGNNNGSSNGTQTRWWEGSCSNVYDSNYGYDWLSTYDNSATINGTFACGLAPAWAM